MKWKISKLKKGRKAKHVHSFLCWKMKKLKTFHVETELKLKSIVETVTDNILGCTWNPRLDGSKSTQRRGSHCFVCVKSCHSWTWSLNFGRHIYLKYQFYYNFVHWKYRKNGYVALLVFMNLTCLPYYFFSNRTYLMSFFK